MSGECNKYLLFCGDDFYPLGGWNDFKGIFITIEDAKSYAMSCADIEEGWGQVVCDSKIILWGKSEYVYGEHTHEWKWSENEWA